MSKTTFACPCCGKSSSSRKVLQKRTLELNFVCRSTMYAGTEFQVYLSPEEQYYLSSDNPSVLHSYEIKPN